MHDYSEMARYFQLLAKEYIGSMPIALIRPIPRPSLKSSRF